MTKPMSDGGKGSVRRNEDSSAYRNNWEAIFGKAKKETQEDIDSLEKRLKENKDGICENTSALSIMSK